MAPTFSYDLSGLKALLRSAREAGATDVHLKVPGQPRFRVDGVLVPTGLPELRPADTHALARALLELAGREEPLAGITDLSVGFGLQAEGRFRASLYRQRGSLGILIHRMVLQPPTLAELKVPDGALKAVFGSPGLMVVTGRGDRMKLIAALIDGYNQSQRGHLVSLESPLEYLHRDSAAMVAQREIGVDVPDFPAGLEAALNGDADVVVATDLPDADSLLWALRLVDAGRSVVAGLAGCLPEHAVEMLVRLAPPEREKEVSQRLSSALRGVMWMDDGRFQYAAR
jgi:twitching motility protein PilT